MISIIVCSRHTSPDESFVKNINDTIGVPYELVHIDNSANEYSIFSAYNKGIELSRFPFLCFVHDDVEFMTPNWGEKLLDHLQHLPNVGLVGVAGGKGSLRIPYGWTSLVPVVNITHSLPGPNGKRVEEKEWNPMENDRSPQSVVLLDGVILCAPKPVFEKCTFDEHIGKFHGYDLDISLQSIGNGYTNYVVFDIDIKHFSKGYFGRDYLNALFAVNEKWEKQLPVIDKSFDMTPALIKKTEKRLLSRLKKRMVRAGLSNEEIIPVVKKYVRLTGNGFDKFCILFLNVDLQFIRRISVIRKLM